jgi:MFS family permease
LSTVFQQYYSFGANVAGLAFLGVGVGSLSGVILYSLISDRYARKKAAEADAAAEAAGTEKEGIKPEYRLPTAPFGAILIPIGLFIYGWTAEYRVHWIVPIIGTMFVGVGTLLIFMALQMYLIDAFTLYAASALAANAVVRSIAGAVLPLAGLPMFQRLGVGWGNSVLAFIALPLFPVAWWMLRYGEYMRKRYPVSNL